MKKTDFILLIAICLYSGLFYHQSPGLNFFFFNTALVVLMLIKSPTLRFNKMWWLATLGTLISSFFVAYHSNWLSIIANIVSLGLLSSFAVNKQVSVLVAMLGSYLNVVCSLFLMIGKWMTKRTFKEETSESPVKSRTSIGTRVLMFGLPFIMLLIFLLFYRASDPIFGHYVDMINLDFISFHWVTFTIGGWLLMYAFFCHYEWKQINKADISASGIITPSRINENAALNRFMSAINENTSGIALFGMLNLLLLIVNLLDTNFLFTRHLPAGVNFSQMVHQGVDSLIWSIIFAVGLILYHFRGRLNFFENNKTIKALALAWIAQNVYMIFTTGVRNYMYISSEGITAKRIGVYVYLGLCIIGLIYTFIKIIRLYTNWQLVRQVSLAFYIALVLSCVINWEAFITNYNYDFQLRHKKKTIDGGYYLSLDSKYLYQLVDLQNQGLNADPSNEHWLKLNSDIYDFMCKELKLSWPSFSMDNQTTKLRIMHLANTGKLQSIYLNDKQLDIQCLKTLKPTRLYLNRVGIDSFAVLKDLKQLKELTLKDPVRGAFIYGISNLSNLEKLDIHEWSVNDFTPLFNCKKLNKLVISNINEEQLKELKARLPNTEIVII